jgi:hypothetical protein
MPKGARVIIPLRSVESVDTMVRRIPLCNIRGDCCQSHAENQQDHQQDFDTDLSFCLWVIHGDSLLLFRVCPTVSPLCQRFVSRVSDGGVVSILAGKRGRKRGQRYEKGVDRNNFTTISVNFRRCAICSPFQNNLDR